MLFLVSDDDDDGFELLFIIERQGKQFFLLHLKIFFSQNSNQVINYNWRAKKKKVLQRIEKEFVINISSEGKVIWKWYLGERKIVLEEYREAKFFSSPRNFCTYKHWRTTRVKLVVSALFFSSKVISFLRYSGAWWSGTQFYWMKQGYIEYIMGKWLWEEMKDFFL